jgi:hypothetical protein
MPADQISDGSTAWDYFLSHASEDKPLIAEPLAYVLRELNFKIWYDKFSLRMGDSLLGSIDEGLRQSRFGIVVLSPSFFAKNWPHRELAGMMALASRESKILPVWHHVTAREVALYSPILADRVGVQTTRGLYAVAEEIIKASFPDRAEQLKRNWALELAESDLESARERFRLLLDSSPSVGDLRLFLSAYHALLKALRGYSPLLIHANQFGHLTCFDFAMVAPHGWSGPVELMFVLLGPPTTSDLAKDADAILKSALVDLGQRREFHGRPANDYLGRPYLGEFPELVSLFSELEIVRQQKTVKEKDGQRNRHMLNIHLSVPETWSFRIMMLIGRRDQESVTARQEFKAGPNLKVEIAAYDRLLDVSNERIPVSSNRQQ